MTSQIPTSRLPTTPKTPVTRGPVKEASFAAASVEDDLQAWKACCLELFREIVPSTTTHSPLKEAIEPCQTRVRPLEGPLRTEAVPVQKSAVELLDEEIELCWPLSKTEGPPGPDLADFKQFHYRVWKMFESSEDLMTDEYLGILRRRDREALKRLVCKHLFENADTETKSKMQYALIEQTLTNTTDASPLLRQKLCVASPDYYSVMELGSPCAPSASRSLKRDRATIEAEDAGNSATPTRPVKMRKLIKTPQLAKQWERRDGRGIYPPSNTVIQWCIDTRKGGKYEHLSCYTSASFPIRETILPEPPTAKTQTSAPATSPHPLKGKATGTEVSKSTSSRALKPLLATTCDVSSSTICGILHASSSVPEVSSRGPSSPSSAPQTTAPAERLSQRPGHPRPSTAAARIPDARLSLADAVKLRKRACVKERP